MDIYTDNECLCLTIECFMSMTVFDYITYKWNSERMSIFVIHINS